MMADVAAAAAAAVGVWRGVRQLGAAETVVTAAMAVFAEAVREGAPG